MKVLANFEDNHKIPSNSSLDDLLDGGFEKGTITQIYGSPSSGKAMWHWHWLSMLPRTTVR